MEESPEGRQGQSERLQQAAVYYKLGKYMDALELLDELARERPDSRHVLYSQGMCLVAVGHLDAARDVCAKLQEIKGHTAASLAFKLKARLEDIDSRNRKPIRRSPGVMAKGLFRMALQPKGLLLCAVVFTGSIFAVAAFRGEPVAEGNAAAKPFAIAARPAAAQAVDGAYLDIPTSYLAGKEEPVRFAIVFCPELKVEGRTDTIDDGLGAEVSENWAELRAQVEEALAMAVPQQSPDQEVPETPLARVAVIPREGLSLAGGLRGKSVDRFKAGETKTLRAISVAAGPPEAMALWPDGTALAGIEGDICWWGRLGIATDDKGVVTHLVIPGLPVESVPAGAADQQAEVEEEGAPVDSEPAADSD